MDSEKWLNENCEAKDWSEQANQAKDFIHTSDVIKYMEEYADFKSKSFVVSYQRELLIAFIDWAEQEEQSDLNKHGLIIGWFKKSNL